MKLRESVRSNINELYDYLKEVACAEKKAKEAIHNRSNEICNTTNSDLFEELCKIENDNKEKIEEINQILMDLKNGNDKKLKEFLQLMDK